MKPRSLPIYEQEQNGFQERKEESRPEAIKRIEVIL
jgi:hypothetical protein